MYQGTLLEFLNMGGSEIILILVVVLLMFGGKKLPELARGLGKGIREFKDASDGVKREIHRNINAMDLDKEEEPVVSSDHTEPNYVSETAVVDEKVVAKNVTEPHHVTEVAPADEKVVANVTPRSTPIDEKIVTDSQKV